MRTIKNVTKVELRNDDKKVLRNAGLATALGVGVLVGGKAVGAGIVGAAAGAVVGHVVDRVIEKRRKERLKFANFQIALANA